MMLEGMQQMRFCASVGKPRHVYCLFLPEASTRDSPYKDFVKGVGDSSPIGVLPDVEMQANTGQVYHKT